MSDGFDTGRVEAFSDGVIAIAITLLILEVAVPTAEFDDLWSGIGSQWSSYLAYATSFLTIGGLWLAHHALFRRLRFANATVLRLNLLLLLFVAFLPFPTELVAEALNESSGEGPATLFYGASLLVCSVLMTALARYAVRRPELVVEGGKDSIAALADRTAPTLGFYVVVIVLAALAPAVAAFGFLLIAIDSVFRPPRPLTGGRRRAWM